jgi:hypothetical protein
VPECLRSGSSPAAPATSRRPATKLIFFTIICQRNLAAVNVATPLSPLCSAPSPHPASFSLLTNSLAVFLPLMSIQFDILLYFEEGNRCLVRRLPFLLPKSPVSRENRHLTNQNREDRSRMPFLTNCCASYSFDSVTQRSSIRRDEEITHFFASHWAAGFS